MGGVPTRTSRGCLRDRDVLSVGAVARAARVAPRTVAKWFDAGLLAGFRLPDVGGKGGDRRVERAELVRFLKERGMPELPPEFPTVLAVGLSPGDVARLGVGLGDSPRLFAAADLFRAGMLVRDCRPRVVVADDSLGSGELRALVAALAGGAEPVPVVALIAPDSAGVPTAQATFRHPLDFAAVAAEVRRLVADPDPSAKARKRKTKAVTA
jgi:two-component system response regulator RpaA